MKRHAVILSVLAIFWVLQSPVSAEVKPDGTVVTTYCGENVQESGGAGVWATRICFAQVVGHEFEVLWVFYTDKSSEILPIVKKKQLHTTMEGKNTRFELTLYGGENEEQESTRPIVNVYKAELTERIMTSTPPTSKPILLTGRASRGVGFRVEKFVMMFHTESEGGN